MDAVITYVNGQDPLWQEDYARTLNKPVLAKRFRDWGTLKYLLRGIEKNMPFVENVFLIVSRESQVPEWVDRSTLRIVLHSDYIPENFLPTFNSNTLELHMHRIEGLGERFLYFNDDMFPLGECRPEDFYVDGKPAMGFARHILALNSYKKICRNSDRLALKALGRRHGLSFIRPQHCCSPMLRSACEDVYGKTEKELTKSMTRTREPGNCTQYLFLDYLYHQGKAMKRRIRAKFFSLATSSPVKIASYIKSHQSASLICINDVKVPEESIESTKDALLKAFDRILPDKSRFEK